MNSASSASINFVITLIYTVTFGNAVYQIVEYQETPAVLRMRPDITAGALVCAGMCMIMALRFFFGNNRFMEDIFANPHPAGQRLYHFLVTSLQSLVLLGSSYLIRNPPRFIRWLVLLFSVEVLWYLGCLLFIKSAVRDKQGAIASHLFVNEMANIVMAGGASMFLLAQGLPPNWLSFLVGFIFLGNTAIDLWANLSSYMGD